MNKKGEKVQNTWSLRSERKCCVMWKV